MKRICIFLAVCLFSALIAWLSGYDFDYRSVGVSVWVFYTVGLGLWAAIKIGNWLEARPCNWP